MALVFSVRKMDSKGNRQNNNRQRRMWSRDTKAEGNSRMNIISLFSRSYVRGPMLCVTARHESV